MSDITIWTLPCRECTKRVIVNDMDWDQQHDQVLTLRLLQGETIKQFEGKEVQCDCGAKYKIGVKKVFIPFLEKS